MRWKAVYNDGTFLSQYNEDGSENKYGDIDRLKLVQFQLIASDKPLVIVHLDPAKKLIYRRRVAQHVTGFKAGTKEVVYIVGWQENRRGVSFQTVCFLFEDGHVEVVDRFREDHPWFYSVRFLPEERI